MKYEKGLQSSNADIIDEQKLLQEWRQSCNRKSKDSDTAAPDSKESKFKQHATVRSQNKKYANIKSSGYGYGGRYQPRSSRNTQRKNRNTTSTVRKTMDLNSKIHYNRRMTALFEEKHLTQVLEQHISQKKW